MQENEEFVREFLDESAENLDQLDQDLMALEANPRDQERLQRIFRAIHTLKGTSGFFGFSKLGALAHDGESLLSRLRDGELIYNQPIATSLLKLIDAIRRILAEIDRTGREGDANDPSLSAELIRLTLAPGVASAGDAAGVPPPLSAATDEPPATAAPPISTTPPTSSADGSPPSVATPSIPEATSRSIAAGVSPDSPKPKRARRRQTVPDKGAVADPPQARDTPIANVDTGSLTHSSDRAREPTAENLSIAIDAATSAGEGHGVESSIRVDVRLLDQLMDLAGELVLARNLLMLRVRSLGDPALDAAARQLSGVTSQLQDRVIRTRMQPIGGVFSKFRRIVRDLAIASKKQVELELTGLETELDRSILEAIRDPVTHMVRNAVDHGIESPDVRQRQGKPPTGHLSMRAWHESGQVHIELQDDGGGIDLQRVKQKAIDRQLITAEQAHRMSPSELVQLIFLPGFSTAPSVTDLSGRGVGMDVVRTNIEKIGGNVEVFTSLGQGTTIRVNIPLTLAIIPALIVAVESHRFALPQASLLELVSLQPEALERYLNVEVFRLRGALLPLVDLRDLLERTPAPRDSRLWVLIVQVDGRRFGLLVDGIESSEEIVVKPLAAPLKAIGIYAGAAILGDGGLALILDVGGLARRAQVNNLTSGTVELPSAALPEATVALGESLVICRLTDHRRIAFRLGEVERLEEFSRSRVETAAGRSVLLYRGEILPLIDLNAALDVAATEPSDTLHVIVHQSFDRRIGVIVPEIVDITASDGPLLASSKSGPLKQVARDDGGLIDVVDMQCLLQQLTP